MPSTVWSVPMSGVHIALRTLWMRIDFPLNRSSAAVLSDRMATRSSTTLRAIDCGTCFEADDCAVRPREIRGTSSPVAASSSRRSEEHTSELQSQSNLVCRLLLEKKKTHVYTANYTTR